MPFFLKSTQRYNFRGLQIIMEAITKKELLTKDRVNYYTCNMDEIPIIVPAGKISFSN